MSFIEEMDKKLNNIDTMLKNDDSTKIINNILKNKNFEKLDEEKKFYVKNEYYKKFSENEKEYQKNNDKYKEWISNYSKEYIEMSEYYVGEELPREHYLQSKKDIIELYKLFLFYGMMEPYLKLLKN